MGRTRRAGVVVAAALLVAPLSSCDGAVDEEPTTDPASQGEVPSESTSASPSEGADVEPVAMTQGQVRSGLAEQGVTYVLEGESVVQPDGGDIEVTDSLAESTSDGIPANWDPPFLILTLEDGVTADDLGISRSSNGWSDWGDLTFRVTDADSEPPVGVLLAFDPT